MSKKKSFNAPSSYAHHFASRILSSSAPAEDKYLLIKQFVIKLSIFGRTDERRENIFEQNVFPAKVTINFASSFRVESIALRREKLKEIPSLAKIFQPEDWFRVGKHFFGATVARVWEELRFVMIVKLDSGCWSGGTSPSAFLPIKLMKSHQP